MPRYKCVISYDGAGFSGYQIQPNGRTVQQEIERALTAIHKGQPMKTYASGRTDAGVHARGQVIHFDSGLMIPPDKWVKALNGLLPPDIAVTETEQAPDGFHARFSATGKEYRYKLYTGAVRDPFQRHYAWHYPYPISVERIREAAKALTGTHDFTSFCSAKTEVEDRVRTLEPIECWQENEQLILRFRGNGFLYNMVRILTGTLLDISSGKIEVGDVPGILSGRDRTLAGKTAPASGLYLWKVFYGDEEGNIQHG